MAGDHTTDSQYETYVIEGIDEHKYDSSFALHFSGSSLFVNNPENLPVPKVGDQARLYGKGFGFPVRGVVCGDVVYYYRTIAEDEEYHRQKVEEMQREKREKFEKNIKQWETDLEALPAPFQKRINRFMSQNKDWCWNFGPYEMFCCKEAVKILNHLKTEADIKRFHEAKYEEQKSIVPDLEYDDHSGNTFGAAVMLANVCLYDKELVPKAHGALCPLVGCKEYGCYALEAK